MIVKIVYIPWILYVAFKWVTMILPHYNARPAIAEFFLESFLEGLGHWRCSNETG